MTNFDACFVEIMGTTQSSIIQTLDMVVEQVTTISAVVIGIDK